MRTNVSLKANYIYNIFCSLINAVIQYLLPVITFKLYSVEMSGNISLAISYSAMLSSFTTFYTSQYQVTDTKGEFSNFDYLKTRIFTTIISCIVFVPFILSKNLTDLQKEIIFIYIGFRVFENLSSVFYSYAQIIWRLDYEFYSMLLKNIIFLPAYAILLYFTKNMLLSLSISSISYIIVFFAYDLPYSRKLFSYPYTKGIGNIFKLIKKVLPLFISSYIYVFVSNQPRLCIASIYGTEQLGYYTSVVTLTSLFALIISFFINPYLRLFAEIIEKREIKRFLKVVLILLLIIAIFYAGSVLFCILFGKFFLRTIYNDSLLDYSYLLIPTLTTSMVASLQIIVSYILVIYRKNISIIICSCASFISSFILVKPLTLKLGLSGANLTQIVSILFYVVIGTIIAILVLIKNFETYKK